MSNKLLLGFALVFSLNASASLKTSLESLYATAFENNWKRITAKTEIILSDYEQRHDVIRTQKQLNELEKFVLTNNLNPVKTKIFLAELDAAKRSLTTSIQPKKEIKRIVRAQPAVAALPVTVVEEKKSNWLVWAGAGGLMLVTVGAFFTMLYKRKKKPAVVYPFESKLSQRDLAIWKKVKPALYYYQNGLKEAVIFSNEKLFAVEFNFKGSGTEDAFVDIKKIMTSLNAELLIQTEWSSDQGLSRKLILNFPNESAA